MGSRESKQGRFGMTEGLAEFRKRSRETYERSQGHDQDVDFEPPSVENHPSELRDLAASIYSSEMTQVRDVIEELEPGVFLDASETNRQKRTIVTTDTSTARPPLPLLTDLPLPGSDVIRNPVQMSLPGPANQGHGNQQRQDRPERVDRRAEQAPMMVPMTDEQQKLLAWIMILERCEAIKINRRNHRADIVNKWATFAISLLGIVGGVLAIRAGAAAVTERK